MKKTPPKTWAMRGWILPLLLVGSLNLAALAADPPTTASDIPPVPKILDESSLDRTANPCEDFYQFACGGWEKTAVIPADRPTWSRSFVTIAERNLAKLHEILETNAAHPMASGDRDGAKLGDYYATCMDEKKAKTESPKTLREQMKEIDALKTMGQLPTHLAALHLRGLDVFFGFGSFQDYHDSSSMVGGADQGGLSLPDRDYYLSNEGKMPEIRKLYRMHLVKMLTLSGTPAANVQKQADVVIRIETELAKFSMSRVERRDPKKVYHRLERIGLKKLAPQFNWDTYFQALGLADLTAINVISPDFFKGFGEMLTRLKIDDLRTYLRWHLIASAAETLGSAFVDENFHFHSVAFGGEKKIRVRWKRCVAATESAMGEPLGRAFVKVEFDEKAKKQAREIIGGVEEAFENNLGPLTWMDEPTKKEALAKAKRVVNQVGYPDKWRDFSGLEIGRKS